MSCSSDDQRIDVDLHGDAVRSFEKRLLVESVVYQSFEVVPVFLKLSERFAYSIFTSDTHGFARQKFCAQPRLYPQKIVVGAPKRRPNYFKCLIPIGISRGSTTIHVFKANLRNRKPTIGRLSSQIPRTISVFRQNSRPIEIRSVLFIAKKRITMTQ